MLEKVTKINTLFEIYGRLLTQKQQKILKLYYYDDLSLAEIAHELDISRQAVYLSLKRSEEALEEYESQLCFLRKSNLRKKKLEEAVFLLEEYKEFGKKKNLNNIQHLLNEIISEEIFS